jgi:dihydropyrimidine dehydrogenase (NAD+) subunit PreA
VLDADIKGIMEMGDVTLKCGMRIDDPAALVNEKAYDAVIVAAGRQSPLPLPIPGGQYAIDWLRFLSARRDSSLAGKRVAIIGCGAVAVDCAVTARLRKAAHVEILYRRNFENAPIGEYERGMILQAGVAVSACTRVERLRTRDRKVAGVMIRHMMLPPGAKPEPSNFVPVENEGAMFRSFDVVVTAIGSGTEMEIPKHPRLFAAGDFVHGESTIVQAVASGKNAGMKVHAALTKAERPKKEKGIKSRAVLAGRSAMPVPLETDFFGRVISSPFLLSAAPHTDGYDQVKTAYESGWAGAVMKTAFDGVPVMIPADYMCVFDQRTYGNCDNVSGHPLDRVCGEIERLVHEFPDRLTIGSTGGPLTGDDEHDRLAWQSNTRKLESAGAMAIEYSLSCPQGGDGMNGDMASQDTKLTEKIIGWILEKSDPRIPKLFKLTGAVTSIRAILAGAAEAFKAYPGALAGITLANSFPSLNTRTAVDGKDQHVITGMSGGGVFPISCLTIARAAGTGITISANGGAMDHRDAARFMALGAGSVQFCTLVMRRGYGIVDDLCSGLSHLMYAKGMKSTRDLIGSSSTRPIADFDTLSTKKRIPQLMSDLCERCGNCTRCPYQAITMGADGLPLIDAASCIGCSLCALKCFAGALHMRERTRREMAKMKES